MANSWGHALCRIDDREGARKLGVGLMHRAWSPGKCSAQKCKEVPVWWASYRYITGRSGRATRRNLYYCDSHARRFAVHHGLMDNDGNVEEIFAKPLPKMIVDLPGQGKLF